MRKFTVIPKRWLIFAAGLGLVLCAPARATDSATITIGYSIPFPSGPPNVVSGSGTFTSAGAIADAGSVDVSARFTAVPSPSVGNLQSTLTLNGAAGTIELRCNQSAHDFSEPSGVVPDTGTCTVIGGTGAYASLHAGGKVIGSAIQSDTGATITETVQLAVH